MLRYKLFRNVQIRGEFYDIVPTGINSLRQQICNRDFSGHVDKNYCNEKVIHLKNASSLLNYIKRQAMWSFIHQALIYCINNMIHIWNICRFCWAITKSTWNVLGLWIRIHGIHLPYKNPLTPHLTRFYKLQINASHSSFYLMNESNKTWKLQSHSWKWKSLPLCKALWTEPGDLFSLSVNVKIKKKWEGLSQKRHRQL